MLNGTLYTPTNNSSMNPRPYVSSTLASLGSGDVGMPRLRWVQAPVMLAVAFQPKPRSRIWRGWEFRAEGRIACVYVCILFSFACCRVGESAAHKKRKAYSTHTPLFIYACEQVSCPSLRLSFARPQGDEVLCRPDMLQVLQTLTGCSKYPWET